MSIIVKQFTSSKSSISYGVGVVKAPAEFSVEQKQRILSKENLQNAVNAIASSPQFLAYEGNITISNCEAAYIEYIADVTTNTKGWQRSYFIAYKNFFITVGFAIPQLQGETNEKTNQKFDGYKDFFELVINTFQVHKTSATNSNIGLNIKEYEEYKKTIPSTLKKGHDEEWVEEVYRNQKYYFRLQFPKQWEYDKGTAKTTLARAIDREKATVISVGVTLSTKPAKYPNNIIKSSSKIELSNFMQRVLELQNSKPEDFTISNGYLNNYSAYVIEFKTLQSAGTKSVQYLTKQVQCMYNSNIYVIAINLPIEEWNVESSIIFDRVVESFIFETM